MSDTAVVPHESERLAQQAVQRLSPQPMLVQEGASLLAIAVQRGADLATIEKLMELRERELALQEQERARMAKQAYIEAKAAFAANPPKVIKDRDNKQYGSKYASIGNFVNTVAEALGKHGLTHEWKLKQGQQVEITCILTHVMGHSEESTMVAGPDTSGQKNPLQQVRSSVTYLELATFQAVTGIVAQDPSINGDDDGNAAYKRVSQDQAATIQAMIEDVKPDTKAFFAFLAKRLKVEIGGIDDIPANAYEEAINALNAKRKQGAK